jgi:hypothetical protein
MNPVSVKVPPGARIITIGFGETIKESADGVRAGFEKAEKDGVASVSMTSDVPRTGLDVLRMRGTPIEMIHSTLVAGDIETANAMFHTTILEYVYEKIFAAYMGDDVAFINSRQLIRQGEDQVGIVVDGPGCGIPFTPEFDAIPFQEKGFVPICGIDGGNIHLIITDHGNAAVMTLVEDISESIFNAVKEGISKAGIKKETCIHFRIGTDLSDTHIKSDGNSIDARANIALLAFVHFAN